MKKFSAVLLALALLLVSQACSTEKKPMRVLDSPPSESAVVQPQIPAEYEDLVKTFDEYWNALIKRDYEKAYNFESTEFRKSNSLDAYKGSIGKNVQLITVRALGVQKISEKEVMVTGFTILKIPPISLQQANLKPLKDKWVKEGESWKHVTQTKKS